MLPVQLRGVVARLSDAPHQPTPHPRRMPRRLAPPTHHPLSRFRGPSREMLTLSTLFPFSLSPSLSLPPLGLNILSNGPLLRQPSTTCRSARGVFRFLANIWTSGVGVSRGDDASRVARRGLCSCEAWERRTYKHRCLLTEQWQLISQTKHLLPLYSNMASRDIEQGRNVAIVSLAGNSDLMQETGHATQQADHKISKWGAIKRESHQLPLVCVRDLCTDCHRFR
jgi:hypothetical protein